MPKRKRAGQVSGARSSWRAYGSSLSNPRTACNTAVASGTVSAKIETQSSDWQAGTTPRALTNPRLGLRPTILFKPAGTRPDPAVSVPRAKLTRPRATATADPALEPPAMYAGLKALGTAP